ncbi:MULTISPECIES: hypothetical protein [unclassified Bradyrhizobium]|uniref:hypothetical protein n=1 Tax=unclassified Bradyrhizobium TaxID=2631580 RepID=UPI0023DFE535|nr:MULTISPECIES: hypothetical protein [unclassified Bradyrhizobium]MCK1292419.1 hypothetical protein [Bradyrhizobium sp. 30]MCK1305043.1 hypothetical protein [Bradyrhizobium sp. 45]MCK1329775.1 hypothetical protein [Bradyrhizobium sp. CW9]MCK1607478.1 hypothetical protein [Bradyrhizobium sp. 163]MCK1629121.1 hypothetical protein [Bradyrhizobium sp. 162]
MRSPAAGSHATNREDTTYADFRAPAAGFFAGFLPAIGISISFWPGAAFLAGREFEGGRSARRCRTHYRSTTALPDSARVLKGLLAKACICLNLGHGR